MVKIKNIATDRELGCFHHNESFSPHSHTLSWEPYIAGTQLKFEDEIYVSESYYNEKKDLISDYVDARILLVVHTKTKHEPIKIEKEEVLISGEPLENLSTDDFELKAPSKSKIEEVVPEPEEIETPEVEVSFESPKEDKKNHNVKRKK